jgi:hypothetical protein
MKFNLGIASTTHIDCNNDKMTKGALDGMAEQVNSKLIPYLISHDFDKQVGVVLYGEVFQLDDSEYALGVVAGVYESEYDKDTFRKGLPNTFSSTYKRYFDIEYLLELSRANASSKEQQESLRNFALPDMLERYLNSTAFTPDGEIIEIKELVASVGDLKIEVYPKDHYPPHFHVVYGEHVGVFNIETLEMIEGDLPKRARNL